jgi:Copper transport outer membrane protein, MctB
VLDFRYHALSLVAVFLALGIGILLGTTIGDQLVSEANRDLSSSLRQDVTEARSASRAARAALEDRERFISASFDRITEPGLRGRNVAIVSSGELPDGVESGVRDAVQDAGGGVSSVSEIVEPPTAENLAELAGRRFDDLEEEGDPRMAPLGRAVGRALAGGGQLASRLADRFPERFRGEFPRVDAIVYFHEPDADRSEDEQRFEQGLIDGLRAGRDPVVGVEELDTDPSQVGFYEDRVQASVDSVDTPGGRIALVLTLRGARGSYGFKDSADAPLPEPDDR